MATVQTVTIYNQPTGVGPGRLIAQAEIIDDAVTPEVDGFQVRYFVLVKAAQPGPPPVPAKTVEIDRETFLAIRLLRGMPTP